MALLAVVNVQMGSHRVKVSGGHGPGLVGRVGADRGAAMAKKGKPVQEELLVSEEREESQ